MQETKILIAGFGGQGVVVVGNLIARACMIEEKNVIGMVSYGVEMRGGTANAAVVVSDEEIACPYVDKPDMAIVLNEPSLDRFEPDVRAGGLMLMNTSLIERPAGRDDLSIIEIDATKRALDMGNLRVANIIALGAFIEHTNLLAAASVEQAIAELFGEKNPEMILLNQNAFRSGVENSKFKPLTQQVCS